MKIQVTSDTLFKVEPKQSNELSDSEKVLVKNGTEFEIQFYLETTNNHLKINLSNATLGESEKQDWYVYRP
ncbi:MAG: peptidase M15 family protein, partial [Cyanobacteria bacterium J06635_15]